MEKKLTVLNLTDTVENTMVPLMFKAGSTQGTII
jgi:hypothetical protein